jgi:hypothetical protein
VEIEQVLESNHKSRAADKLRGINEAIAAHPNQLDEEALIVFNLTDEKLSRTLKVWRKALREAGNLACVIRYCTLRTFMQTPYIDAIADLPILTPPDEKPDKAEGNESVPPLAMFTLEDTDDILAETIRVAHSIPAQAFFPVQEQRRLLNFFAAMQAIFVGDFAERGGTTRLSLFPVTSLERLTAFLHLQKNRTLLTHMRRGFKEVRKRQSGVTLYQDAISKFIWGTFLRQFGLGRGGPLTIYIIVPEVGGLNTDIGFKVHWTHADINAKAIVSEDDTKALEWVLSAFLLYPEELGLVDQGG